MRTPYELFGWEIREGWVPLVEELIKDLKELGWDGTIHQIKEKWGGLRFYIGYGTEDIWNRIEMAERKSLTICEVCGEPGELRTEGWMETLCEKHFKEKNEDIN